MAAGEEGLPAMHMDEALSKIDATGSGRWARGCTRALAMQSLVLALECNVMVFVPACAVDLEMTVSMQANLVAVPTAGALLGTVFLMPLADIVGRLSLLIWTSVATCVFSVLSVFAPTYLSFLLLRTLVGVAGGPFLVAIDLLGEYVPPENRGATVNIANVGWGVGAFFINALAWWCLPQYGWRVLVLLATLPYFVNVFQIWYLVESPRWLLTRNRQKEAMDSIRYMAAWNESPMPCGRLVMEKSESSPIAAPMSQEPQMQDYASIILETFSAFKGLLHLENRSLTLAVWGIWATWGFSYVAIVLFQGVSVGHSENSDQVSLLGVQAAKDCNFDYGFILFVSSAEIVGALLARPIIDRTDLGWLGGRRGGQLVPYLIAALTMPLVATRSQPFVCWAYLARAMIGMGSGVSILQIPELYSTEHRATGSAAANLVSMIAGIFPAFLIFSDLSVTFIGNVIAAVTALGAALLLWIPEMAKVSLDDVKT